MLVVHFEVKVQDYPLMRDKEGLNQLQKGSHLLLLSNYDMMKRRSEGNGRLPFMSKVRICI